MECAGQELREILEKFTNQNIDIKRLKSVNTFLKGYKTTSTPKRKFLKLLFTSVLVIYGVNYYFSELQTKVG